MQTTGDQGRQPETSEMYDSDMHVYTSRMRGPKFDPAHVKVIDDNIALMKKWAAEGN